jgi:hypothetical protein
MTQTSGRLIEFLGAMRDARCFGVRDSNDGAGGMYELELYYDDDATRTEKSILLRAELRDGAPVIVLPEDARLSHALRQAAG